MSEIQMSILLMIGIIVVVTIIKVCKQRRTNQRGEIYTPPPVSHQIETQFGPVNYYANDRNNMADNWFQFEFKKVENRWLVYILRMPCLDGRDPNLHYTHRYKDNNRYWICYDPQPDNLKDAQTIARGWADRELEYIATGRHFEEQIW